MSENNTKITEARMGQIALLMLTHRLAEDLPNVGKLERELPNMARTLRISVEELRSFAHAILPKAVGVRLGCSEVSLVFVEKQVEKRDPCDP